MALFSDLLKNQESSDGPINDVAASAPASAPPQEDTERTPEDIGLLIEEYLEQYGSYSDEPDNDDNDNASSNSRLELVKTLFTAIASAKEDRARNSRVQSWLGDPQLRQSIEPPTAKFSAYEGQKLASLSSLDNSQSGRLDETRRSDVVDKTPSLSGYMSVNSLFNLIRGGPIDLTPHPYSLLASTLYFLS
ncbi:hypothetical protein BDR22DRAFT_242210 [Usnea florida]